MGAHGGDLHEYAAVGATDPLPDYKRGVRCYTYHLHHVHRCVHVGCLCGISHHERGEVCATCVLQTLKCCPSINTKTLLDCYLYFIVSYMTCDILWLYHLISDI